MAIPERNELKGLRYEEVFQLTFNAIKEMDARLKEVEDHLYIIEQFNSRLNRHPTLKRAFENYKNAYEEFLVIDKLIGKE